jgi:hypothetical protein
MVRLGTRKSGGTHHRGFVRCSTGHWKYKSDGYIAACRVQKVGLKDGGNGIFQVGGSDIRPTRSLYKVLSDLPK